MTNTFPLTIAAVDTTFFEGEAESVTVPATEGEMTVLKNHESFVTVLKEGKVVVRTQEGEQEFAILEGMLEVHKGGAVILL